MLFERVFECVHRIALFFKQCAIKRTSSLPKPVTGCLVTYERKGNDVTVYIYGWLNGEKQRLLWLDRDFFFRHSIPLALHIRLYASKFCRIIDKRNRESVSYDVTHFNPVI